MVLFWPIQQELDCISHKGDILGKIAFIAESEVYSFLPADQAIVLSAEEQSSIQQKVDALNTGNYLIPMQDDD